MANYNNLPDLFGDIADAIRLKSGGSAQIPAVNFPTEIHNLPTGSSEDPWAKDYEEAIIIMDLFPHISNISSLEVIYG